MIPRFPVFRKIELSDKNDIDRSQKGLAPYSDFNFVSLYCWNTDNNLEVSLLNNNIIVKMTSYTDSFKNYLLIGEHKIRETVISVMDYQRQNGEAAKIVFLPEEIVDKHPELYDLYTVIEDRDNFDYIYDLSVLATMKGSKLLNKRNHVNKFTKENAYTFEQVNLSENGVKEEILDLFNLWAKNKAKQDVINERLAMTKVLSMPNILVFAIKINGKIKAFVIEELLDKGFVISHFEKADIQYKGIYETLKKEAAEHLLRKGYWFLNAEQDLGIPGLRRAKMDYCPKNYFKKYVIFDNQAA